MVQNSISCPCGNKTEYSKCCQPIHRDHSLAKTPEQLMRSRYSAFILNDVNHLRRTWMQNHCPDVISTGQGEVKWVHLQIEEAAATEKDTIGSVSFKATFISDSQAFTLYEKSTFRKVDNLWYYVQGEAKTKPQNIGKNSKCPCLSGRKFKRCCGRN